MRKCTACHSEWGENQKDAPKAGANCSHCGKGKVEEYQRVSLVTKRAIDQTERKCIKLVCGYCEQGHQPERRRDGWMHPSHQVPGFERSRGSSKRCAAEAIWEVRYKRASKIGHAHN
jgi:hypothetical protein